MIPRVRKFVVRCSCFFVFLVSAVLCAESPQLSLDLGIGGRWFEEDYHKARTGGGQITAHFNHQLHSTVEANIEAKAYLETGTYESAFVDEYGARNRLQIQEASLNWTPLEWAAVSAGVLDQGFLEAPALIGDKSFLGVRQSLKFGQVPFYLRLQAQQALVESPSRTFFPSVREHKLPAFMVERAVLGWDRGQVRAEARISHFSFVSLPNEVQHQSRFFGNTATGLGRDSAELSYNFYGFETGASVTAWLGKFIPCTKFSFVRNLDPPSGQRDALTLQLDSDYRLSPNFTLGINATVFRIESDASPAYYSLKEFGHNNREGYGVGLKFAFPKDDITFQMNYTNARSIQPNTYQSGFQGASFVFETSYDLL